MHRKKSLYPLNPLHHAAHRDSLACDGKLIAIFHLVASVSPGVPRLRRCQLLLGCRATTVTMIDSTAVTLHLTITANS
jgi:hypothetical protein